MKAGFAGLGIMGKPMSRNLPKVSLTFTSLALQALMAPMNNGRGELGHSAIATFPEDMARVAVKRS